MKMQAQRFANGHLTVAGQLIEFTQEKPEMRINSFLFANFRFASAFGQIYMRGSLVNGRFFIRLIG
jgi:hypothetical protein